jgi:DNA-binding Xre family transcriptional regulator
MSHKQCKDMKTIELQQEAKHLLNDFLAKKQVSKVKLSKKIGISHAVLTYIDQEQWEMVSDEMLLKIINALKVDRTDDFQLIKTENFNTIQSNCNDAAQRHLMLGLVGYTGAGKTTALNQYYKQTPNVYYVECKNIMNRKQFFANILKELGLNVAGTVYDMVNRIIEEFNSKENPLLIIDEAGKLSHTLILDLHDLRNATQFNLGIILSGCEYFKDNLETSVNRRKQGMPEFYSRVVDWVILSKPSKREIETILEVNGASDVLSTKPRFSNFREVYNAVVNFRFGAYISEDN